MLKYLLYEIGEQLVTASRVLRILDIVEGRVNPEDFEEWEREAMGLLGSGENPERRETYPERRTRLLRAHEEGVKKQKQEWE